MFHSNRGTCLLFWVSICKNRILRETEATIHFHFHNPARASSSAQSHGFWNLSCHSRCHMTTSQLVQDHLSFLLCQTVRYGYQNHRFCMLTSALRHLNSLFPSKAIFTHPLMNNYQEYTEHSWNAQKIETVAPRDLKDCVQVTVHITE